MANGSNINTSGRGPLNSLKDAYVRELRDLYSAEQQLAGIMPKMAEAATDSTLKKIFQVQSNEAQAQAIRLEQIFVKIGLTPEPKDAYAMRGLHGELEELVQIEASPEVRDAVLISLAQRMKHYEIAGYGSARTFADQVGDKWAADQLQATLGDENRTDKQLSELAVRVINVRAR